MKNKLFAVSLAAALCLSLMACGNSTESTTTGNNTSNISQNTQAKPSTDITPSTEKETDSAQEVASTNNKIASDTITINANGVTFQLGDEWETVKSKLESNGFDLDSEPSKAIYHVNDKNDSNFYYVTREIDGKQVVSFVQYVLPTEAYLYDKNFQVNFVLFNGYTVLEGKDFISAHNLTPVKEVDRYGSIEVDDDDEDDDNDDGSFETSSYTSDKYDFSIMEELISVGIKTE